MVLPEALGWIPVSIWSCTTDAWGGATDPGQFTGLQSHGCSHVLLSVMLLERQMSCSTAPLPTPRRTRVRLGTMLSPRGHAEE